MRLTAITALALTTLSLSGCAGSRYAQEVNRLKAEINMLNERLSQVERSGMASSSTAWPDTMSTAPADTSAPLKASSAPAGSKPSKKAIQQALKNAGFYQGPVDGKVGPQTREAIKEFQRINGLKADGVVGRQTWEKLSPYVELSANLGESTALETTVK